MTRESELLGRRPPGGSRRGGPLDVKALARIVGKSSGEAGFLKRALRYDTTTESFFWCSGKRHVQDAAATLQLTGRSHECTTADTPGTKGTDATLRDGDQKLDGNETAAFRSALGSATGVTQIFGGHPLDAGSATSRCLARRRSSVLASRGPQARLFLTEAG